MRGVGMDRATLTPRDVHMGLVTAGNRVEPPHLTRACSAQRLVPDTVGRRARPQLGTAQDSITTHSLHRHDRVDFSPHVLDAHQGSEHEQAHGLPGPGGDVRRAGGQDVPRAPAGHGRRACPVPEHPRSVTTLSTLPPNATAPDFPQPSTTRTPSTASCRLRTRCRAVSSRQSTRC